MSDSPYDLVVIGGGPAGYAAAIRAGQLGKKVACVEKERPGGTCLNWGCIPSKALLKAAETLHTIQHAEKLGFSVGDVSFDFSKIIQRSRGVSDQMAKGIEFLFKKNKVDYIRGVGQISAPGMVEITEGEDKGQILTASKTLIATGCKARQLPDVEVDGETVFTSREALVMKKQPKSIVIVGAGAIGVEFAYFLKTLGTEVHLVEMLPQILPHEDKDTAAALHRAFKKQKLKAYTSTKVENIQKTENGVTLELVKGEKRTPLEVDALLLSIGIIPNTEGLLSNRVKLKEDRGYLVVNDNYETNVKGIYAAGDIIGPPWLAHVATYEAVQAVNGMFGHGTPKKVSLFPSCTYCQPQVASVGMTEAMVQEKGIDYKVGKFPFSASGKAVAIDAPEGFVKVITDAKHGEILGAHIIGHDATELIGEYGLAMNSELTAQDIHDTIHAHPTLSEASMEAVASIFGEAIHI